MPDLFSLHFLWPPLLASGVLVPILLWVTYGCNAQAPLRLLGSKPSGCRMRPWSWSCWV